MGSGQPSPAKPVLLTGASGFIGQCVARSLKRQGYTVHGISSSQRQATDSVDHWHTVDLLQPAGIQPLLKELQPARLMHLAWYLAPGQYNGAQNLLWMQSTLELMRAFYEHGGERMVVAGSGFEYDRQFGYCTEQLTPLNPDTWYGQCKQLTGATFMAFVEQHQLSGAWGRVFNVYGPGEGPTRLVASVILALLREQRAACSSGLQYRDFLHVYDVANGLIALLHSDLQGAVNIASGVPVQVAEIVTQIGEKLDRKQHLGLGDIASTEGDLPLSVAKVDRLTREVGFTPQFDLSSGLDQTIDWWRNHPPNANRQAT